jgi:hypothetical protein
MSNARPSLIKAPVARPSKHRHGYAAGVGVGSGEMKGGVASAGVGVRTSGMVGVGIGVGQGVSVGNGVSNHSGGIVGTNSGVPEKTAGVGFTTPPSRVR